MQPERGPERGRPPAFPPPFPIWADRSWIPAGALLAAHLAFSAYGERPLVWSVLLGLLTAAVLFACVAAHGFAHVTAARLMSGERIRARLYVFGDAADSPRTGSVAVAGPVASGALGGLLLLAASLAGGTAGEVLRVGAWASFAIAAINIVPGLPLDGGHVLASFTHSRQLALRLGQLFGLFAAVAGIWLLLSAPAVIEDTAFGLWLLLGGIFVLAEGRASARRVPTLPLDGESAGAWARPFAGRLETDDPVPFGGGPYAVSDGARLAGVVTAGVPDDPPKRCAEVMVPWASPLGIKAETPLRTALERLADATVPLVVVVDDKGIVRGVLDEAAVREHIT